MSNNTNGYPLRLLLSVVDRITQPLNAINKRIETFTAPVRMASNALASLGETAGVEKLVTAFSRAGSAAKNVGEEAMKLGKRVAIGVAAASFALYEVVQRSVDSASALKFQGGRLGMSPSWLAAYGYAAKQAGIDQEGFFGGLDFFNKTLGQLKANEGPLHRLLKENWPGLLKQLQGTKSNENAFSIILAAADKLPDLNKKAALFAGAFGRGNKAAVDMATEGTAKFRAFAAQWREMHGGMDFDAFAKESVEFIQAENKIGEAWEVTTQRLLKPVLPILLQQLNRLATWATAHSREIDAFAQRLSKGIGNFFEALPARIDRVVAVFDRFRTAINPIARIVGGWPTLFATVGTLILAGPLIGALGKLATALVALSVAEVTNPIGWVAIAVEAIAAGAILIIANWEPIKKFFSELWAAVQTEFQGFLDFLEGAFTRDLTKTMAGLRRIANPMAFVKPEANEGGGGSSLFDADANGVPKNASVRKWMWTPSEEMDKTAAAQTRLRGGKPLLNGTGGLPFAVGLPELQRFFAWIDGVNPSADQSRPLQSRPINASSANASLPLSSDSSAFIAALEGLVDQLKTAGPRVSIDVTAVPGTRAKVTPTPGSGTTVDLSMGYAMAGSH